MKRIVTKKHLLCMIIVTIISVFMYVGEAKADTYGFYKYTVDTSTKTVTIDSYTGDELEVKIPSKLGGCKVTKLGHKSFYGKMYMQSVSIPSTVTTIDGYAFANNKALKSIIIPNNVKTLGYYMCGDNSALTSVTIGSGVKEIPNGAFRNCSSLTSVKLSNGLTKICGSIGYYGAFADCTALKEITIPTTVTEIAEVAFSECKALEEVVIPDSVKKMGEQVFAGCKALKKITIGTGLTIVPEMLVYNCSSLEKVVFKGNNIIEIDDSAFANCKALKEITLPKYVDVIHEFVFSGCSSLKNVNLNEGLMSIHGSVFADCISLEELTIPSSVINYTAGMLRGCNNLKKVLLLSNISTSKSNPFASVKCPEGSLEVKAYSNNEFVKKVEIGGDYKYFYVVDMEAKPSTSLAFSKKSVTLAPGGSVTLPATMTPEDSTDSIIYISSNNNIATVNQRGKITAKNYGAVNITARTNSNMLAQITVNVLPKKVTGFKDAAQGVNSIKLQWNEQAGVDGYYVYRKVSGKWKYIKNVTAKSSAKTNTCVVSKLPSATTQQFAVNAYKIVDGQKFISPAFPTVTSFTLPSKVTNFKKSVASKTAIKTTWKKVSGATGYVVYRYQNKKWVKVATTKNNYYTYTKLKRNTSYKLCVKAYKTVGTKTEYGATTTLTTKTSK